MHDGGTLQVHLGPYRSNYLSMGNENDKLPFDMDIVMRDHVNLTTDQRIHSENISIVDEFHPMMSGINTSVFAGINGGTHVALSGLDTSQVNAYNLPLVCRDGAPGGTEGGRISDGGTFHSLIGDSENPSQSLLSTCNYGQGGMIVTTIDVENPAVSQPFGDSKFPLLSNLIDFHLTPYPDGFEIAGEGFHLTIDGQTQSLDVLTGAYQRTAIKSGATLEFSFESDVPGLIADWVIESADGGTVTGWDGESLGDGNRHVSQVDPSTPVSGTFCVSDESAELGCKIDADWRIWLYLHDSEGHTRITNISIYTNDINADSTPPVAHVEIIQDSVFQELVEFVGYQQTPTGKVDDDGNWIMIDSPKYRVRLSDTGTTDLKFSAANSSDIGTGIMTYTWTISGDGNQDHIVQLPSSQVDWHYTFRNLTPNQNPIMIELEVTDMRGQDSSPTFRIFFEVVGEQFGDDEPQVEMDSINTADGESFSALEADIVNITGTVTDNDISNECDVTVEAVLDDISILDASPAVKTTNHELGRYDIQTNLCDGDTYTLSLNISHLHSDYDGSAGMIHVRVTEGSYQVSEQIQLYTVARCVANPESCEEDSGNKASGSISGVALAGVGATLLIAILAITLFVVRGRRNAPEGDSVESFGGVEEMDPVEAYVQQLVAQGYDEQMARQYATQYYAQYYEKQRGGGG